MIQVQRLIHMIEHWLATPPNGYFGQDYGADIASILLQDLSQANADKLLDKLRVDIPLLSGLDSAQLSIETQLHGMDALKVFLFVGNTPIYLGDAIESTPNQDYYDSRAQ